MPYKFTDQTSQIGIAQNKNTGNLDIKRSNDHGDLRERYQGTHDDYVYVAFSGTLIEQLASILAQNTNHPGVSFTPKQINAFAERLIELAGKSKLANK